jgi:membrane-associated protease RseP (regulator of RpoE activity)
MSTCTHSCRCLLLALMMSIPLFAAGGLRLGIEVDEGGTNLDNGVVIAAVDAAGLAARIGLRSGDVIVGLDDTPIATIEDLQDALAKRPADALPVVDIRRGALAMSLGGATTPPPEADDAVDLADLIATLNALPERIDQAASEFKRVYPNGEFDIQISVSIKSNAKAKKPLKLMLGEAAGTADTASASGSDTPTAEVEPDQIDTHEQP